VGTASAVPVTWNLLQVQFQDGGTASGSFVYDADTNTYSNVNITTTAGSARPGATYAFVCVLPCVNDGQPNPEGVSVLTTSPASDQTGLPILLFGFLTPLTNAGAKELPAFVFEVNCADATCSAPEDPERLGFALITTARAAPIPTLSTWGTLAFVLSLVALGFWQLSRARRTGSAPRVA
jgi:hypothetical protein